MVDKAQTNGSKTTMDAATAPAPVPPKRAPGHRNTDVRDTVAEMAARAQEISQEAGSKVAQAMKDVINAAAGLAGFAVESARDLVQYMVRRGQMTQEEADRLMREAEEAAAKRRPAAPPVAVARPIEVKRPIPTVMAAPAPSQTPRPAPKQPLPKPAAAKRPKVAKPAAKPAARAKKTAAAARPKLSGRAAGKSRAGAGGKRR